MSQAPRTRRRWFQFGLKGWLRLLQFFCGFALVCAVVIAWLFSLSFINRILIYRDRQNYKPDLLIVREAVYAPGVEPGDIDSYWLVGSVAGRDERLVPRLEGLPRPRNADELAQHFPPGTQLPVLFNPDGTDMLVQNESLRVVGSRASGNERRRCVGGWAR